jgi:hypothetical protein
MRPFTPLNRNPTKPPQSRLDDRLFCKAVLHSLTNTALNSIEHKIGQEIGSTMAGSATRRQSSRGMVLVIRTFSCRWFRIEAIGINIWELELLQHLGALDSARRWNRSAAAPPAGC